MTATDTKTRILDAAEQVFAEKGRAGFALRAVTMAAGVNVAAVNYHFGSMAGLLRAMAARFLGPVNARQLQALDDLEEGGRVPPVEEILDAFVAPLADLLHDAERGALRARLFGRIMTEGDDGTRAVAAEGVAEVNGRYLRALRRALPEVTAEEAWWRYRSMAGVVVASMGGWFAIPPSAGAPDNPIPAAPTDDLAQMRTFLIAALRAPATPNTVQQSH